ncbi:FHA domain-containing protein [Scytonema sp. NUACC26]|uniref:FHA domain-containing protein n=1 Tax=Scytonema sp. NUACC26 TaxID=3140176 RepID=UPI0034DB82C0
MKVKVLNSQTLNEVKELNLALATRVAGECIVGRSPNADLVIDSPDVSRLHGKFLYQEGEYYFYDLGSRNGSIVNGHLAQTNQSYKLKVGDIIRMGEFVLMMEEINLVPEDLPETVCKSLDATVISGWREAARLENYEVAEPPQEVVNDVSDSLENLAPEKVTEFPASNIQSTNNISQDISIEETTSVQEVTFVQSQEVDELKETNSSEVISIEETRDRPWRKPYPAYREVTFAQPSEVAEAEEIDTPEVMSAEEKTSVQENTFIQPQEVAKSEEIVENSEIVSEVAKSEKIIQHFEIVSEVPLETNIQSSELLEEITDPQATNIASQVDQELVISENTNLVPEVITSDTTTTQTPEVVDISQELAQTPEETENISVLVGQASSEESETSASRSASCTQLIAQPNHVESPVTSEQAPVATSQISSIISTKYIALIAHESKRADLEQFVAQHQEFFSQYLTLAPPSISERLDKHLSTSIKQIPATTSGGYQAIASMVANGDILAVIFLRDFMTPQSSQANEEALLRVCNINQVLIATNVPTAEAIVHYIRLKCEIERWRAFK